MKEKFLKILTWIGIMSVLTIIAMLIWTLCWGSQTTTSLKWLQFLQTIGTFLLPPVLCAWLWDAEHKPLRWLHLDSTVHWRIYILAVVIMLCAIPGINLLVDLNGRIVLPPCLEHLEQILKRQEEAAAALTLRFLQADNFGTLLINIGLMALLPALAEELSFRGTLQQILSGQKRSYHLAIWVTAFIFSAIHMQFYGFIPRMLMGAMFGYIFVWTGSLWVPVLMHFTNNAVAVLAFYFSDNTDVLTDNKSIADTIGSGDTWWIGVISLLAVTCLLVLFTYPDLRARGRRTHTR